MVKQEVKIVCEGEQSYALLPMTSPTGKVRIKRRSHFKEYGIPVATRSDKLQTSDYVEWQIGYDLSNESKNLEKTTLSKMSFTNSKRKTKYPYE